MVAWCRPGDNDVYATIRFPDGQTREVSALNLARILADMGTPIPPQPRRTAAPAPASSSTPVRQAYDHEHGHDGPEADTSWVQKGALALCSDGSVCAIVHVEAPLPGDRDWIATVRFQDGRTSQVSALNLTRADGHADHADTDPPPRPPPRAVQVPPTPEVEHSQRQQKQPQQQHHQTHLRAAQPVPHHTPTMHDAVGSSTPKSQRRPDAATAIQHKLGTTFPRTQGRPDEKHPFGPSPTTGVTPEALSASNARARTLCAQGQVLHMLVQRPSSGLAMCWTKHFVRLTHTHVEVWRSASDCLRARKARPQMDFLPSSISVADVMSVEASVKGGLGCFSIAHSKFESLKVAFADFTCVVLTSSRQPTMCQKVAEPPAVV